MRAMLALLFLLLATPALAVDGVLEINQACAQTGCFPNDGPGFPIFVDRPGAYRLTSNLVVLNENTDAIRIGASSITIDLNGFEIARSGCEGAASDCTPDSGSGSGIELSATAQTVRGITVRNGSITGMGSYGVLLGEQSEITNLRVRWNRLSGIVVGTSSTVRDNTAYENGENGINAWHGSILVNNAAFQNDQDGIRAGAGATVIGNTAYQNVEDGIQAGSGSAVSDNAVRYNGGFGLSFILASRVGYRNNTISSTTTATVNGGIDAGGNVCNGAPTCP